MLSSVYLSQYVPRHCVTALQRPSAGIHSAPPMDGEVPARGMGYRAGLLRFYRRRLRRGRSARGRAARGDVDALATVPRRPRRGQLFQQTRAPSLLDKHIDAVHDLMVRLMQGQGVFHIRIHYSSGRCSLWRWTTATITACTAWMVIIDPDICLAYPLREYPTAAR